MHSHGEIMNRIMKQGRMLCIPMDRSRIIGQLQE